MPRRYTALFTPYQISFLGDVHTLQKLENWLPVFVLDRLVDTLFVVAA